MKAAVPAESYIIYLFIFLHHLESPAMSTGSSQVGAALSRSLQYIKNNIISLNLLYIYSHYYDTKIQPLFISKELIIHLY